MIIEKNGVKYYVSETASSWSLKMSVACVDVTYNVSKADCDTFEELKQFVAENDAI